MKKAGPETILISSGKNAADIHCLCGAKPPEPAVFIQKGRSKKLIVSEMEYARMRRSVRPGVAVLHPGQIGCSQTQKPAHWIRKGAAGKRLVVSGDFPLGMAEQLRRAGYRLSVSKQPACPQRLIKNKEEIRAVRIAQQAAVAAMQEAIRRMAAAHIGRGGVLREGNRILTSEVLRAAVHRVLFDLDCTANETIIAGGPLSSDPHERGSGPLRAGEPVVLDIFPQHRSGFWGDITRTVCRGPAPDELKKMYSAVKAAQLAALRAVKAGAWTDDVHAAAAGELDRRGFETGAVNGIPQGFIHGTGHGVGLEIHEAPRVSAANHQKLKAGMIITIEPGLYYPHIGGVRIEDTVLVTRTGVTMLAPCPKRLEI